MKAKINLLLLFLGTRKLSGFLWRRILSKRDLFLQSGIRWV